MTAPSHSPPEPPLMAQPLVPMIILGRAWRYLPPGSVVVRCGEQGGPTDGALPRVRTGEGDPELSPDTLFRVLYMPTPVSAAYDLARVAGIEVFTKEQALQLCDVYVAPPRSACLAQALAAAVRESDAEIARLRAEVAQVRTALAAEADVARRVSDVVTQRDQRIAELERWQAAARQASPGAMTGWDEDDRG